MDIKLILSIPYSKYDVSFEYSKLVNLTEFESLIVILVFCKNRKEISLVKNLSELIVEKYNVTNSFLPLFEKSFDNLKKTQTIIINSDETFYDILIGNIDLNSDVEDNLKAENFFGLLEEKILRKNIYFSNLLTKSGLQISDNISNVKTIDIKDLFFFINVNKTINENFKVALDLKGAELTNRNNEAYIGYKYITYQEEVMNKYENIIFNNEEVIFSSDDKKIYSTDKLSEEILSLYSSNVFYYELPDLIVKSINTKIIAPITTNDFPSINDSIINNELLFEIDSNLFYILEKKIIKLYNRKKELIFDNKKDNKHLSYNELCKEEILNYNSVILKLLNEIDSKLLSLVYKNVDLEIKELIVNNLFEKNEFLKNNILFLTEEFESCLLKLKEMKLNNLLEIGINDQLLLKIFINDSNDRKYISQLKEENISELLHADIIKIYHFEYTGNNYYFKKSDIENEINAFYNNWKSIDKNNLDACKEFKISLTHFKKGINPKIVFTLNSLEQENDSFISTLELQKKDAIEKKCGNIAIEIRQIIEPLYKEFEKNNFKEFVEQFVSNKKDKEDLIDRWKFNHTYLHDDGKNHKDKYSQDSLSKLEVNKKVFEEFKKQYNKKGK